jgi:hypothetical protein
MYNSLEASTFAVVTFESPATAAPDFFTYKLNVFVDVNLKPRF